MEIPLKKNNNNEIELSYEPTIPLLGIYPEKPMIKRGICTPVFVATPFTIARTWKKPRSMDR